MLKANRKTSLTILTFLLVMVVLPAGARSAYAKTPTILLVSDCSAPGTYTGTHPNDEPERDNSLVSFLEDLGYTVDTSGMNKAYQQGQNPFNDMAFVITGTEPPRERFEPISFTYSTLTGSGTIAGFLDARACGGPSEVYFEAPMPVPAIVDPHPHLTPAGAVGTITEATGIHNDQGKTVGIDWSGLGPVTLTGTAGGTTYTVDVELIFGPSGDISYNNPDEDPLSSYDPLGEDYVYTWTIEISDDALAEHGGDAVSPGGDDNPRMAVYLAVGREEPNGGCHRFTQLERQFNEGPDAYTNDDVTTDATKWSKFAAYQDLGIYYGWRDMSNIGDGSFQIDSIEFGGNLLVDTDNIIPQPGIIFVDANAAGDGDGSSWAHAYNFLQDALADSAVSGKKIFVAEGIYKPDQTTANPGGTGDRAATFRLINDVGVYGGFPSGGGTWEQRDPDAYETILSGDLNGDDGPDFANNGENSYHVVTGSETDETAVLDGFTITAGNSSGAGGGMYNINNSSPTVTNCTFSVNTANYGGGMFNYLSSSPTVTNCLFTGNEATYNGGGMHNDGSSPTVTNCTFADNTADVGGGMYNWSNSSPTVTNCTFSGNIALSGTNGGGGMYNQNNCSPTVTNCTFSSNMAIMYGGGMYNYNNCSPTVTNCIFNHNIAEQASGGGIANYNSSHSTITNCTFSGNTTGGDGGGIRNWDSSPTVTNCILWGNEHDEISSAGTSVPVVNYSDIRGGHTGTGNIETDPNFVDAQNPDPNLVNLRLLPDSPCIDKGSNSAPNLPPTDLAGNRRIFDGDGNGSFIVDMGAYEFGSLNLLAHWKLDESTGGIAYDSSGDNHGTLQPPTPPLWQPAGGRFNGALEFDGDDDAVRIPKIADSAGFTYALWVKQNVIGSNFRALIDHKYWITGSVHFELYYGKPKAGILGSIEPSGDLIAYDYTLAAGEWNHVVLTKSTEYLRLYVDANVVAERELTTSDSVILGDGYIGEWENHRYFNGLIDDVAIFSRALDVNEIIKLRNNGGASFFGDANLKALWELDESSGGIAFDSAGVNHGTLEPPPPPVWQPAGGRFNGALLLDGVDDYIDCGNDERLNITDEITLSVWVNTNDAGNGEHNPYVTKGDHSYAIKHHSVNSIEFFIYDGGWHSVWYSVGSSFNDDWHHLAGTYDGSQLILYVDGVSYSSYSYSGSIAGSTFNVNIGRNAEITDRFYDGLIDDVAIFSRALTPTEITQLGTSGGSSFIGDPNLKALWELDESSGTTACDSSGSGIDGSLEPSSPLWQPDGGQLDGALEFDGFNDCVHIPNESRFDITNEITVSAWIKVNAFDKDWQAIVTKGNSAWRLHRLRDTNSIAFHCNLYPDDWGADGSINVNNGQWHHVAGVYDGTQAYLYVDGVLDSSEAASGLIGTNNHPVMIGENAERPGRCWNGLIDDVRIYPCALGPAEIYQLYSTICYVDADAAGNNDGSSWTDAFNYLQDALAQAAVGWEIRVAEGTYKPDANSSNPTGTGDRTATFQLINRVILKGGYAGFGQPDPNDRDVDAYQTVLSGDIGTVYNDTDNSYHVVTGSGTDATSILDGFTITGGFANGSFPHDSGAGMFNSASSPTVTNCTFSENRASTRGGGMFNQENSNPTVTNCRFSNNSAGYGAGMRNNGSSPTVTNCTFSENTAGYDGGGMENRYNSSPTVTNCTFSGNSANNYGGGMYNYDNSNPTVTNCRFSNNSANWGGGMYNYDYSSPTVTNCTFEDNEADVGGGMCNWSNSSPTVTNCTFSGNIALSGTNGGGGMFNYNSSPMVINCTFSSNMAIMYGGGMYNYNNCSPTVTNCIFNHNIAEQASGGGIANYNSSHSTITNCTFSGNTTGGDGGGIRNWDSSPTVTNCILWGNEHDEISSAGTSVPVVNYSDIRGGHTGTGNIETDPNFVDAQNPDPNLVNLRLRPGSPCIDVGNNSEPNLPPTDLDGRPRIIDGDCDDIAVVDMGAYEFAFAYVGDFDNNCSVDFFDVSILARAWMTEESDPDWNWICDISDPPDDYIDWRDAAVLCDNWLAAP